MGRPLNLRWAFVNLLIGLDPVQHLKAGHIGQAQIQDHTIKVLSFQQFNGLLTGFNLADLHIAAVQQLLDTHSGLGIVFYQQ